MEEIKFVQLNMHRATGAATILNINLIQNLGICLLTEPCTTANKVTHVPTNHTCTPNYVLTTRPRAAIYVKTLIASIYLDYNEEVVQPWLEKVMEYADRKKLHTLLAFDCNAHSTLYGPDTNARGKVFKDFILKHNLLVENRGFSPTYHAFRRGANIDSCIDVTLSKGLIPLSNWRVHDMSFNGSDHHTISWTLPLLLPAPPMIGVKPNGRSFGINLRTMTSVFRM